MIPPPPPPHHHHHSTIVIEEWWQGLINSFLMEGSMTVMPPSNDSLSNKGRSRANYFRKSHKTNPWMVSTVDRQCNYPGRKYTLEGTINVLPSLIWMSQYCLLSLTLSPPNLWLMPKREYEKNHHKV